MANVRFSTGNPVHAGLAAGLGAYLIWGFILPLYIKVVSYVDPIEVVAHRVVWTVVILAALLLFHRGAAAIVRGVGNWRMVRMLMLTAALITANWLIFIWAVMNGRVLESSLGYYINPLVNVVLGVLFLGERLSRRQTAAIGLVVAAVLCLVVGSGSLPWIALALPLTFGVYGLIRKRIPIDPVVGLLVETALVLPLALGYIAWLGPHGAFNWNDPGTDALLVCAGPMTFVPLLLFLYAAKRLKYSTIGLLQYLSPSGQFLLGVWLYGEPFSPVYAVAFAFIWLAIILYSSEGLAGRRTA